MKGRREIHREDKIFKERHLALILIALMFSILSLWRNTSTGLKGLTWDQGVTYIQILQDGNNDRVYAFPSSLLPITLKDLYYRIGLKGRGGDDRLVSGTMVIIEDGKVEFDLMDGKKSLLFGLPIDINSADIEDLIALPGIGEKLAIRILKKRQELGMFRNLDDLKTVKGLGEKKIKGIKDLIMFAQNPLEPTSFNK